MNICFLIPARGGSKGVPNKNLSKVGSRSLLEISIDNARGSNINGDIIVSSENSLILDLAKSAGVDIHLRAKEAANDEATADDVVLDFIINFNLKYDVVIYLQPTSPFRTQSHINDAFFLFETNSCDSIVSVKKVVDHPQKTVEINKLNRISHPSSASTPTSNRQSLPDVFIPNGAIYIFKVDGFLKQNKIPINDSLAYFMNPEDSIDIDTYFDLKIANLLEAAR